MKPVFVQLDIAESTENGRVYVNREHITAIANGKFIQFHNRYCGRVTLITGDKFDTNQTVDEILARIG